MHSRAARLICERCGSFACELCAAPHCVGKPDGSERSAFLGVVSLLCALSTLCFCAFGPAFVLVAPLHLVGLACGVISIQRSREKQLEVSVVAVQGTGLNVLALIADAAALIFIAQR